jgi:hypothetical protein
MRSRASLPVVVFVVAVAAGTIAMAIPFVTRNRDFPASIPSPAPLYATDVIALPPGQSACFGKAVAEQHSRQARFRTTTYGRPGPPLRLTLAGPGYTHSYDLPGGYPPVGEQRVAIQPPARPTPLRVCIANRGKHPVGLFASSDRTRSRSLAIVGGHVTGASVVFGFWETGVVDVRRRLPDIAERITIFRPAYVGKWFAWTLALLLVVAIPAALLVALRRTLALENGGDEGA